MADFFLGFVIGFFLIIATLWIVGVFNMSDDEYEDEDEEEGVNGEEEE